MQFVEYFVDYNLIPRIDVINFSFRDFSVGFQINRKLILFKKIDSVSRILKDIIVFAKDFDYLGSNLIVAVNYNIIF